MAYCNTFCVLHLGENLVVEALKLQYLNWRCWSLRDKDLYLNRGEDDVKGPHAGWSKSAIDREASGSETGPKCAWVGRPRPTDLACSEPGSRPPLTYVLFYILSLPPLAATSIHPSIHKRAADTKEKHWEEADGHHKSSSCLEDGLGHSLAAMVGPAWWSHGGDQKPMSWFHQGNCTFYIRWWYKSCLFFTFIYIDECFIHMYS
jgi:hypothetical protein